MAQQDIIIGTADATQGDTLFSAFTKTQANSTELFDGNLSITIVVNQANLATTLVGTIDSTKVYFLDGVVDFTGTGLSIEIPVGGMSILGSTIDISGIRCTDGSYTLFESPIGGSGNLLKGEFFIEISGVGSQVQDITDALTATHELGHNIDWLMNNKLFPSSIKARFPNATIGEMSLRNELKKISQIIRPDMWEWPKPYIKSHVELMADYISHYILDPEKTREIARNLTKAFEAKLAEKPELFDIISRLQESRYTGPIEPAVAKHIREDFPLPKEFTPLQLAIDMTDKDYVKAAEELGITAVRHYKLLIQRAQREPDRIDD